MHSVTDNFEYLLYRNDGRGGTVKNPYEDDGEEEVCVMNACSCKICFNYYTDIMFEHRKTDSEKLAAELLAFSTPDASEETSAVFNQEKLVQPESDCESLVNNFLNLRISSPKKTMTSRSEIMKYRTQLSNAREPSFDLADYKTENLQNYSEEDQSSTCNKELFRNQLSCYDFGEVDKYLENNEIAPKLLALKNTVETTEKPIDRENHMHKPELRTTSSTSTKGWYSWEDYEWNECFDNHSSTSYGNFIQSDLPQGFTNFYHFYEYTECCEFPTNKWTNHNDSNCSNISHNLWIQEKPSFEPEWDKLQYFFSTAPDRPLSESSVCSDSLEPFDETVCDEQYQADISSNFENDDLVNDNISCDSYYKTKSSIGHTRDVFDKFSGTDKNKKRLGGKRRRRPAMSILKNDYSDSDNSEMLVPFMGRIAKEQCKDKVYWEEVKFSYHFESSLSHEQIWTIYYDSDSQQIPRIWKRSLQQTKTGAREQIRQYFEELKSKFGTEFNLSVAISNDWHANDDFLDYDCTWEHDDQRRADLSTSSDETLTRISICSDSDYQEYNTIPEKTVKPKRTNIPYEKAGSSSKARRSSQAVECAQFKQFDSDESFEFCGGSKPISCA